MRGQLIVHSGLREEPEKPQHRSSSMLPPPSVQPSTRSSGLPRRYESKVTERGAETQRLVGEKKVLKPAACHRSPEQLAWGNI